MYIQRSVFVEMLTPSRHLIPPLVYPEVRVCRDAYSSYTPYLTSGISRGLCLLHSQICISSSTYEIDDCSLGKKKYCLFPVTRPTHSIYSRVDFFSSFLSKIQFYPNGMFYLPERAPKLLWRRAVSVSLR
jgi:hypothetical protein